jgi:hypothetical protein
MGFPIRFLQRTETAASARTREESALRWLQVGATGFALMFVIQIVWAWAWNFKAPNFTDYLSYWAAGKLTLGGDPAAAYDVVRHRAMEATVTRLSGLLPFPYPPPFLALVTPFSLLPYHWGFAAWVLFTGAVYVAGTRRVADLPVALAHPSVLMNGLIGQNGLLTCPIFVTGAMLLRRRPFVAGVILGLLVMKPQLALLLPVAVIAGRLWPAVAGAAASSGALLLIALGLFGFGAFEGFVKILPLYTELMRQDKWPWNEFISVFAFVRWFGVDHSVALAIHAIVALAALALTWIAWSRNWPEQVPILAAATLLIPPYLLTYDALLMIVPIGFWLRERPRPYLAGLLWLLCFLPISFYFHMYRGPNTVPLAAILSLCALAAGRRLLPVAAPAHVDHPDLVGV